MPTRTYNTNAEGHALDGYDAVAYFDGAAIPGRDEYELEWNGASWKFSTDAKRKIFESNPEYYAPQFGGYCAFGMGFGKAADADPKAFVVDNGKLYLSASSMVRRFWKWFGNHEKSERNWRNLKLK